MNELWIAIIGSGVLSLAISGLFNMRRATADAEAVKAQARATDVNSAVALQTIYSALLGDERQASSDLKTRLTAVETEQDAAKARYGKNTETLLAKIEGLEALVRELKAEQDETKARYGESTKSFLDKIDGLERVIVELRDEIRKLTGQLAESKLETAAAVAGKE